MNKVDNLQKDNEIKKAELALTKTMENNLKEMSEDLQEKEIIEDDEKRAEANTSIMQLKVSLL